MGRINIGHFKFSVSVEKKNIKYIRVKIEGEKIIVKIPSKKKIQWNEINELIFKRLKKLEIDRINELLLTNFLFFGNVYKIRSSKRFFINHQNKIIYFNSHTSEVVNYLSASLIKYAKNYVKRVYKKFGMRDLPEIEVKPIKNKLAYLSNDKIVLNFILCFFPRRLIRYVIDHELIHYKVKSHNSLFRRLITTIYPDYKEIEKELKKFWIIVRYNKSLRNFYARGGI